MQYWTATILKHYQELKAAIDRGALVVVNHSGGKDSQATYAVMRALVPAAQLLVVHANLGNVEWPGTKNHIRRNIDGKLRIANAIWKDGTPKNLLQAIERRGKWPSAAARYCTSDLKRGPCNKVIRAEAQRRGITEIISCFGFRAEESKSRAKRPTWQLNTRMSKAGRTWIDFSPIHDLTTAEVFDIIKADGQAPHPAYAAGMTRLSCCFCVLGSTEDLRTAARLNPDLYQQYLALETRIGHTFKSGRTLAQITGVPLRQTPFAAAA